jgi:hypothetical protein
VTKAKRSASPADLTGAIEQLVAGLRAALLAGDLLQAEMAMACCLMLRTKADESTADVAGSFIELAAKSRRPEDAAMLRLIMSLGSPSVKRAASRELSNLTRDQIYPADWVADAGKATPLRATRHTDAFEELQVITVIYGYAGGEHAVSVAIDVVDVPEVLNVNVTTDVAELVAFPGAAKAEETSLAEARRRIEPALDYTERDSPEARSSLLYLPIARSRLRRLPVPDEADERIYTADDRKAAVDEFMTSPQASAAVAADEAGTRFWAEILTAYSSRMAGEPPGQAGPHQLRAILALHVPTFYPVTEAQRAHLGPAVTAWASWSAARRGITEAASELTDAAGQADSGFDQEYDEPTYALMRGYLTDLVTSEADVAMLRMAMVRRTLALPLPDARPGQLRSLDAADPATRRACAAAEFAGCNPPAGMTEEQLIAAAERVVEELWTGEPLATWEHAERLAVSGMNRHDIIHALADPHRTGS